MSEKTGLSASMPDIRVPAGWTLGGLATGLALGLVLQGTSALAPAVAVAEPLGAIWLRSLQMTILPLVTSLLVLGIVQTAAAAHGGAMVRRTLGLFATVLASAAVMSVLVMPLLLRAFPIPQEAVTALREGLALVEAGPVPGVGEFLQALVPSNVVTAAASGSILPVIVFFALFGAAITRLPQAPRAQLTGLFEAIAGAMLVVIGWVLWLAPLGVFALGLTVAANSGVAVIGALAHYIVLVSSIGGIVLIAAYVFAVVFARLPLGRFAREMLPVQAVAISTQSSLASLPAMLAACRALGVKERNSDLVLPLAVALFRATGPAMNLAVAVYVAQLAGVDLTVPMIAAGVGVALLTTLGSPGLPGTISFVISCGPIALAMGVPVGPLALLVAVEVLPDLMRTVGNVTMDVAATAIIDRRSET